MMIKSRIRDATFVFFDNQNRVPSLAGLAGSVFFPSRRYRAGLSHSVPSALGQIERAYHSVTLMPDQTKIFIDFQYGAIVGLLQQLIVLASGTLVLSLTFVDKIVDLKKIGKLQKSTVVAIWVLLVVIIVWSFFALQYMFIAASLAVSVKIFRVN